MADYFCSEPPNILPFEGTGIGYESIVKLKGFAQPMHRVFIIKYCILLKNCGLFPHTSSSILLAYHGHGISNMVYMPQVFHFPD